MANEQIAEKRAYFGAAIESTRGSGTITFPGEAIFCETISPVRGYENLQIRGEGPHRPGYGSEKGKADLGVTGSTYFSGLSLAANTDYPRILAILAALGFDAATTPSLPSANYAAGPPKTIWTELLSYGFLSAVLELRQEDIDGGGGLSWLYNGCNGTGSITFNRNGFVTLDFDIKAASITYADYSVAVPSLTYADSVSETRRFLVNKEAAWTLKTVAASPATFGGCILEGKIDLNMDPQVLSSSESADGICRVLLDPTDPISGTLVVDAVKLADFDVYGLIGGDKICIAVDLTPVDDSTEAVYFEWFAEVLSVEESFDEKRKLWTINWSGVYPDTGRDGQGGDAGWNNDAGVTNANNLRITWEQGS